MQHAYACVGVLVGVSLYRFGINIIAKYTI